MLLVVLRGICIGHAQVTFYTTPSKHLLSSVTVKNFIRVDHRKEKVSFTNQAANCMMISIYNQGNSHAQVHSILQMKI